MKQRYFVNYLVGAYCVSPVKPSPFFVDNHCYCWTEVSMDIYNQFAEKDN